LVKLNEFKNMLKQQTPLEVFDKNIEAVHRLMNFDRDLIAYAIIQVEGLHNVLVTGEKILREERNGKRILNDLKNIRDHDSMRTRYEQIFNQAVVLLVSHFGSLLGSLFRLAVDCGIEKNDRRILKAELNIDIEELLSRGNQIHEALGEMLVFKKDISFQDMKSVSRAFKDYFGINIEKSEVVHNIIIGQACRHSIVHDGGRVNTKTVKQVAYVYPRKLKPTLIENEEIKFSPDEVTFLASEMRKYAKKLFEQIEEYKHGLVFE
jgi:hypothetical protein